MTEATRNMIQGFIRIFIVESVLPRVLGERWSSSFKHSLYFSLALRRCL